MYLPLFEMFDEIETLPVQVSEIRDALIRHGFQDVIIFQDADLDPNVIKGLFFKYVESSGVYGDPVFVAKILYPREADLATQRLICAKELIHLCDPSYLQVNTPEKVNKLAEALLGPMEVGVDESMFAEILAKTDAIAEYQCLDLLFPKAARRRQRSLLESGQTTKEEIAALADIPERYISLALNNGWEEVSEGLRAVARMGREISAGHGRQDPAKD